MEKSKMEIDIKIKCIEIAMKINNSESDEKKVIEIAKNLFNFVFISHIPSQ